MTAPHDTQRREDTRMVWICDECPTVMEALEGFEGAHCAGSRTEGTAHKRRPMRCVEFAPERVTEERELLREWLTWIGTDPDSHDWVGFEERVRAVLAPSEIRLREVAPVQSEGERLEAANARELLLRDALEQAQNAVEFMHGCLTDNSYRYAYPEYTQRHLDEWAALAPRREPCSHSRTERGCASCADRQERYHALAEARALLRDLEAKPRLSHSGPIKSKGSPPTTQEARTDG